MNYIILDILKTSIYISIPILFIVLFKDKVLNKYTYHINYIFFILITLRMLFISSIKIYLPIEFFKTSGSTVFGNYYYVNYDAINSLNYVDLLFIIWALGFVYAILSNIYKQIIFYKKIKNINYRVTDSHILNCLEEEKKYLNIKRNIKIFKVDGLSSPALVKVFNSEIIIPNKDYDKTQLKWIFRHELIHYKRKDNLLKLLLMIACSIHWFNPLTKVLRVHFNEQCELSCDEKVINNLNTNDIKEYALVLIGTLRYRNSLKATMLYSQFNTNQIDLIKRRIEEMINLKERKKGMLIIASVCAISLLSILSFNINSNQRYVYANESTSNKTKQALEPNASNKTITKEDLKKNLENVKKEDMKDYMEFYQDRKFEELTQEEVDYAMNFLFTGKCKVVHIGSDTSHSINLESLYKVDNN
ncbi:M56 family metallopeptidase [Paraclostridium dentum]|uniref:M56 family metallopeptidase n=1 Tax=Paraclostridium dentum TaxID=2662455 RepID=UPI003F3A5A55